MDVEKLVEFIVLTIIRQERFTIDKEIKHIAKLLEDPDSEFDQDMLNVLTQLLAVRSDALVEWVESINKEAKEVIENASNPKSHLTVVSDCGSNLDVNSTKEES